jgi:hypothetical protein
MANDAPTPARFAVLALVSVSIAVLLVGFWAASASELWSSDPWLINMALAISLCGPVALSLLLFVLWLRRQ